MKSLIFQNTHQQLSFTFLFAVIQCMSIIKTTQGCKIHGTDSGVCTNRYLPSTYYNDGNSNEGFNTWEEALENSKTQWALGTDGPCLNGEADFCMPFCGKYIANYYPPCVPNHEIALPKDHNFPNGRFAQHTTRGKDKWVEEQVTSIIKRRIELETNRTAHKLGLNEYGFPGKRPKIRFYRNVACQEAYKKYFCWLNFPRCDEFDESLPMCQSACENFFRVCGYDEELWRCNVLIDGNNDFDAIETNSNNKKNGKDNTELERDVSDYFPGQPFKRNEYVSRRTGEPHLVCTPSIKGDASIHRGHVSIMYFVVIMIMYLILF